VTVCVKSGTNDDEQSSRCWSLPWRERSRVEYESRGRSSSVRGVGGLVVGVVGGGVNIN